MSATLRLKYPAVKALLTAHAMKQRTESRQFLAWFLENYYRLEETELSDCICDGQDDKGIDAIYVNEQLQQIDIFQSRLMTKRAEIGDTELREFYGALSQMRKSDSVGNVGGSTKNKELASLIRDKQIAKKVADGYKIQGVFLTNAKRNNDAVHYLKNVSDLLLYDAPELEAAYVAIDKTDPISTPISFDVSKVPHIEYQISNDVNMVIAPLAAIDLVKMDGIANGELFAWNVRQWLGKKTKVNRDIETSIKLKAEHRYFPAFHNGLTVLCKNLKLHNGSVTISGYAVVNGCQSLTGLYENKNDLTPQLRILTKFVEIAPESVLARKITDHTNNQNGTTYRDLQSNNLLQTRLQSEVHSRYNGLFYYRIKRGEHPEWTPEKVIENELAARILLAYDVKEPWSCHQTYRLFDDLHARIFGRPEVNGDRIVAIYTMYEAAREKLGLMQNDLFAHYGLTKFLLLYLIREALETDEVGTELTINPSKFLSETRGLWRSQYAIGKLAQTLVRLLDAEINRRNTPENPFDFKRELKSLTAVRDIRSTVISQYQIAIDSGLAPRFEDLWKQSATARKL